MQKRSFWRVLVALFFATFFVSQVHAKEVVVYNWSEYIPQEVLDNFTKETGIKVVYSTFESNEAMYAKVKMLRGKSYDVLVPSSYYVDLLVRANLLQKIDASKISNLKNIDAYFLNQKYDPKNEYSIPYMWGLTGLAYNSKKIQKGSITKWADLEKPELKGRIIMTDDLRSALGLALMRKGYSINSTKESEIKEAYEFLKQIKPSIRVFDVTAIKQALISEEVWIGPIWNGDFLVAKEEKPELEFVFPEEGSELWTDNFVIPVGAKNVDNAYTFINYMLRPEVAAACVNEFKYSTPNKPALKLLPSDMQKNNVLVPRKEDLRSSEFTAGVGSALKIYDKYWKNLKTK